MDIIHLISQHLLTRRDTTDVDISSLPVDSNTHTVLPNGDVAFGQTVFTTHEMNIIRYSGISSASVSLLFGLISFYFFLMINPRKRVFRHKLILILISFDFLKAIVLLIYPVINRRYKMAPTNRAYVNALGFFTAFAIEGADFVILVFAIHIAMLIFRPNRTSINKSKNNGGRMHHQNNDDGFNNNDNNRLNQSNNATTNIEGGLYFIRYKVYALVFFLPLLLACLGFIHKQGYQPDISYAYLTVTPVWYRIVLSWMPRYCIVVCIMAIYGYVYYHVLKEYKKVTNRMNIMSGKKDTKATMSEVWGDTWWYKIFKLLLILVFPDVQISAKLHGQDLNTEADLANLEKLRVDDLENNLDIYRKNPRYLHDLLDSDSDHPQTIQEEDEDEDTNRNTPDGGHRDNSSEDYSSDDDLEDEDEDEDEDDDNEHLTPEERIKNLQKEVGLDVQRTLHKEAMEKFQIRRIQVTNQMKVIFIYPLAYILLWLFPFIFQCLQFKAGHTYYKLIWLNCTAAFFQAFSCSIDSIVFLIREQPWRLRIEVTDPKLGLVDDYPLWRKHFHNIFLPGFTLPETYNECIVRLKQERLQAELIEKKNLELQRQRSSDATFNNADSNLTNKNGATLDIEEDLDTLKMKNHFIENDTNENNVNEKEEEEDNTEMKFSLSEILPMAPAVLMSHQSSVNTNNTTTNVSHSNNPVIRHSLSTSENTFNTQNLNDSILTEAMYPTSVVMKSRRSSKFSWKTNTDSKTRKSSQTSNVSGGSSGGSGSLEHVQPLSNISVAQNITTTTNNNNNNNNNTNTAGFEFVSSTSAPQSGSVSPHHTYFLPEIQEGSPSSKASPGSMSAPMTPLALQDQQQKDRRSSRSIFQDWQFKRKPSYASSSTNSTSTTSLSNLPNNNSTTPGNSNSSSRRASSIVNITGLSSFGNRSAKRVNSTEPLTLSRLQTIQSSGNSNLGLGLTGSNTGSVNEGFPVSLSQSKSKSYNADNNIQRDDDDDNEMDILDFLKRGP